MDSISSASLPTGLSATAAAVSKATQEYDERAAALVQAAAASPEDVAGDLAGAATALTEQRVVNEILYATFRAQAQQQQSMVKELGG